jgi:hypothetical protein
MERGRPRTIGDKIRDRICLIARTSPADWGITTFSTWSLSKFDGAPVATRPQARIESPLSTPDHASQVGVDHIAEQHLG